MPESYYLFGLRPRSKMKFHPILSGLVVIILLLAQINYGLPVLAQEKDANLIPGEVLIGFNEGVDIESSGAADLVTALGGVIIRQIDAINVVLISVAAGEENSFVQASEASSLVAFAEQNGLVEAAQVVPPDPDFAAEQAWHYDLIRAPEAWGVTMGSPSVIVAMLDSGIDLNHPDLAANIWANDDCDFDLVDDDLNGYVDDCNGWDFAQGDNNPIDQGGFCNGHGTHTAGTVAAVSNSIGGLGVAPQASLMAVKVLQNSIFGCTGSFADIADGITYAVNNGANIISMSIGCGGAAVCTSATIGSAFSYADNNGVLVVVAAGNDSNTDDWGAYANNIVEVAALDQFSTQTSYSNFGSGVHIAAPGGDDDNNDGFLNEPGSDEGVYSTQFDNTYSWKIGTSMATPHVAGCAALVLSRNPALTDDDVKTILMDNAVDLGVPGRDDVYGWGRLDCKAAVDAADTGLLATNLTLITSPNPSIVGEVLTISGSLTDSSSAGVGGQDGWNPVFFRRCWMVPSSDRYHGS